MKVTETALDNRAL